MERRWKVLMVTAAAVFMGFLDVTIVNIAFPDIRGDFNGDSLSSLSWILNAYNVVFAALLIPAGRLADRLGRKRLFMSGLAVFGVASLLCAVAPSVPFLVGARVVQAAGGALLVPASLGLLLPEFPIEKRATATALWGATGAVAAATGPSLGGLLVDAAGWRWVFLVNVPIAVVALGVGRGLLRESREPSANRLPDPIGVALLGLGVAAVSLGIVKSADWGWGSTGVVASLAVGAALLIATVARSTSQPAPVFEPALFRVRSFAVANGAIVLFATGFYALLLCNVLFLTQVWHYSVLTAGVMLTPSPIMAAISAAVGGRLADRFGQRVIAVPGLALFAIGGFLMASVIGAERDYAGELLPIQFVTGIGIGLSFASLSSAAVAELPPMRFATGTAIFGCGRQVGAVLGVALLIAVIGTPAPAEALTAFHHGWELVGATGAAAMLLAAGLGRVRARVPESEVVLAEVGA
ncbi:MAG TPA: DHA2 family efflux MFS transporter permease subunit [Thermoleophilaceae bacterium]